MTPVAAASATTQTTSAVIVVMRAQHPDLKPKTQTQQREQAVTADQSGVLADLRAHGATGIEQFDTVSAVAAKTTPDEVDRLRADPAVAAVVPDRFIPLPAQADAAPQQPGGRSNSAAQLCPANPAKPLLEPDALSVTNTESADPNAPQAHSLATGKGVRVAFLADGLDIDNPDFIRKDGSHVFFDYQDFSGDGTGDDSGGDEAFGDASSLAAQGNQTYDLSTALPNAGLPAGCTFRVRGFAPDASLAAIKVFGQYGTTESAFVRGIDYAVTVDKVDVLSESFGGNPFPDTSDDPVSLADQAAIDAGVTVVASSGDSGISGTVGSPASVPDVIAAGATTAYRLNAMNKGYAGYVDDNITGLSSGGATLDDKYVDLVAPGMTGMAVCTPNPKYWSSCSTTTEVFGGTSQSAPFIAGASALVIQAYSQAHHGAKPSPEQVKQLLTGTATDLNAPADQQGAGLLNSYAAVRAAADSGSGALIPSATQLDLTGPAGSVQHTSVTLTNSADRPQAVLATSRAEGRQTFQVNTTEQVTGATGHVGGPGEDPTAAPAYSFTVPAGTPWLDAEMTWPGTATSGQLAIELFDPAGRLVQESYDYGFTDYQHIGVHNPAPGRWTEQILWDNGRDHFQEPLPTAGSYRGAIALRVTGSDWSSAGVAPQAKVIPAHGSATFNLAVPLAQQAGDAPASIQFDSNTGTHLSLPVARRSLIPTDGRGSFAATITGGVGRGLDQYRGFFLDVPAGKQNMTVDLNTPDPGTRLNFFLVSPSGEILSGDTNAVETAWNNGTASPTKAATLTVNQPVAGRWQLIVLLSGNSSGHEFSEQVGGRVVFNAVRAHANNLPGNPARTLPAHRAASASVTVTNTGSAGAYYFLDPRLTGQTATTLTPVAGDSTIGLPEDKSATSDPSWLVPPHTSGLTETVHASLPVDVDLLYGDGNPEVFAASSGGTDTVDTTHADQLAFGYWFTGIGEIGPFATDAQPGTASIALAARTQPFDPAISSGTGDFWSRAAGGSAGDAVFVPAGATVTIPVTITPNAARGTVVRGTIYVDTMNNLAGQGSEVTGIPYSYTVG
ncbi:MAG TPA: S8 family serine peptidase [Pseudonocardiaceae bacterium]|nr:S8 family serine peptidase [Pseudonocardiaceae bacterium]